ncbi:hypothetical protein [Caproicibacterium sp. XB2]|jgi:hypothetical protein|uniref:hypothetical protein n=1 Tax=Caproicibacterium TaxID=2834348 RepID=UPI000ECF6E87|nr:hypothetical protein [Oscillospiraceae bacterium]HCA72237.1 hypothetical protein [Oscillospiraceae bacterium]HCM24186.1 hypothetical protein [Oscillospiraceae bacterium]
MDYQKWGQDYLKEAKMIQEHLQPVRQRLKQRGLSVEESRNLAARESMLYQMYLECRSTGLYLQRSFR